MARLIVTFRNKVVSNHMISSGEEHIIGRDPGCQIIIDDPAVSSRHARVRQDQKGCHLTDLGSTNGTFVNEDKVVDTQLAHQDWVLIGKHILIVDLYETLSLDATVHMLQAGSSGAVDADGTMMLDMQGQDSSTWGKIDYLTFTSGDQPDLELSNKPVTIGKNKDADIVVTGFWGLFAGQPSAMIRKRGKDYYLEHVTGTLKPKLNDQSVIQPTRINHNDTIRVGSVEVQLFFGQ